MRAVESYFVEKITSDLEASVKHNKRSLEKLALSFGIVNKNLIKELAELAIVKTARKISRNTDNRFEAYQEIVELYQKQANLSHRTSKSMMLQQYSTPAPIAFIASLYAFGGIGLSENKTFFEPSAGNGLLTIALPENQVFVNEVDDVRLEHLKTQNFAEITHRDATLPFVDYYKKFSGVITNPPFGVLSEAVNFDGYKIKTLDHLMALRALDTMKDTGRAAIIIGGHTNWDEKGRTQAGKNRIFFNYLYSHYNVEDVILIDGHKLYSRQGTAFDVRMILIRGRKLISDKEFAPRVNDTLSRVITDFDSLWDRVFGLPHAIREIHSYLNKKGKIEYQTSIPNNGGYKTFFSEKGNIEDARVDLKAQIKDWSAAGQTPRIRIIKAKAQAKIKILELIEIS